MADGDRIPAAIRLLLAETFDGVRTGVQLQKRLKPLVPELRRQSDWTLSNFRYADHESQLNPSEFVIRTSGALDPFSPTDICENLGCRINAVEQFGRTAGLFADRIVIPDVFTRLFANIERLSEETASAVLPDVAVLERLRPLIEAGVVQFSDGSFQYCKVHDAEMHARVSGVATSIIEDIGGELRYRRIGNHIEIDTGNLFTPPLLWISQIPSSDRNLPTRELAARALTGPLRTEVAVVLRDMKSAHRLHAPLLSGSRLGLLAIKRIEGNAPELRSVERWEAARSVDLPFVERLRLDEVMRLRDEAANALPRLRALLGEKLATSSSDGDKDVQETVRELRSEAAEVEAELKALKLPRERGFRTLSGGLGLTIAIYGVAAGFVAPAVGLGSLLSLLGLIHAAERHDEKAQDEITSRPGYVLLKARELLEHRH